MQLIPRGEKLTLTPSDYQLYTQVFTLQLLWLTNCAFQGWINGVPFFYIFRPAQKSLHLKLSRNQMTHWKHLRPIKTEHDAYPEASLNNGNNINNAPNSLSPKLAQTPDRRPGLGTSTPRNRMILKYIYIYKKQTKKKKRKVHVFFSYLLNGRLRANCGPVEKIYCTIRQTATFKLPSRQSRLRADRSDRDLVEESHPATFVDCILGTDGKQLASRTLLG